MAKEIWAVNPHKKEENQFGYGVISRTGKVAPHLLRWASCESGNCQTTINAPGPSRPPTPQPTCGSRCGSGGGGGIACGCSGSASVSKYSVTTTTK